MPMPPHHYRINMNMNTNMALLSLPCQFSAALSPLLPLPRLSTSTSTSSSKPLSLSLSPPPSTSRWQRRKPIPLFRTCTSSSHSHSHSHSNSDSDKEDPPWMPLWTQLKLILHRLRHLFKFKPTEFLYAAFLLLFSAFLLYASRPTLPTLPYSDLVNGIKLGHVSAVDFEEGSRRIYFHSLSPSHHHQLDEAPASTTTGTVRYGRYLTRKMDRDEKFLLSLLRDHAVIYRSVPPPLSRLLLSCIGTVAGVWIAVIPVIWILERRLHGNATKKKKSPPRQIVSFHDVQGVDSAKQELIEVVNCLRGTLDYKKLGAKLPTGILLVGPPGTGKTLLARAVAGEAGVPFFSVSASEFVELYVGRGAARVRDLFKEARQEAPAVVFIDELDAVGTERDGFSVERDQTLNQLLTEMDGFDSDKQVIVLAATNRPAALDPALMRPGRFSRKVLVGEPDLEGRKRILAVHLRGVPLEEETEVVCDLVASLTEGFVGADLANIANEAALLAVRRGGSLVTREDIMEAIEREKFGINEKKIKSNAVRGKGLVEMFPWIPSLAPSSVTNRNKNRDRNVIGSRRVLNS